VGSFFSSYTVSGSFSRSAVAARTGAKTGMFAIFSAAAVMIVLLFLTPLLYHLPQAVLAVIVMMAVFGLINVRVLIHAWQVERQDAIAGIITFVATLAMAPALANGILLGVAITVVLFLVRTMRPRAELVARHPDGNLVGARAYDLPPLGENFAAVRFDGSLNFVNAAHFEDMVLEAVAQRPNARAVLVIASGINYVDASGEERVRSVAQNLADNGVELYFSGIKRQVDEVFRRGRIFEVLDESHFFRNKERALEFMFQHYDHQRPAPAA
jgi:anti-anti-sigma factor